MNHSPAQIAAERLLAGYNCAQAVLCANSAKLGLNPDTALRLACGFGGGVARDGEICGAVSGAIIAVGLKHGRGEGEEKGKTEACYTKTQELIAYFRARHGSIVCRELTKCDLRTADGRQTYQKRNLQQAVCVGCVRTAAELADQFTQ